MGSCRQGGDGRPVHRLRGQHPAEAKGHVWNKSSMEKETPTYAGIDTDARWGKSRSKGWLFGYKLHVVSSTGSLIVPLSASSRPRTFRTARSTGE